VKITWSPLAIQRVVIFLTVRGSRQQFDPAEID
jgi:hypothetical protein